jgi:hypothetical protein
MAPVLTAMLDRERCMKGYDIYRTPYAGDGCAEPLSKADWPLEAHAQAGSLCG